MHKQTWAIHNAPPLASSLIESLRGLGYSPATALADIIDNSIAADASRVELSFVWDDTHQYIAILDNGHGMTFEELLAAMKLGHINPLSTRAENDLGRFGLGLKTASFSQCRSLTVLSRTQSTPISSLRWDLDLLAEDKEARWQLLEEPGKEASNLLPLLEKIPQGTLVVWEKLDRVITSGFTMQHFLDLVDEIEKHLALTFHRFLEGSHPKLVLTINGRSIRPVDPFMQDHPATWSSPEDIVTVSGKRICLQGHVLPHKDRLSRKDIVKMGDPESWTEYQGFYIYRNRRLIVAGSWLGLGRGRAWSKEDAYRLARIRIDIPNTADMDWNLDIRKSVAVPPALVKKRLLLLAETVRGKARHVFAYRGEHRQRQNRQEDIAPVWEVMQGKTDVRYHISRAHPVVASLLADKERGKEIESLLTLIENTVPVQRIWLDAAEGKDAPRSMSDPSQAETMKEILTTVYRNMLRRSGLLPEEIRQQLKRTEPFCEYTDLVDELPDQL